MTTFMETFKETAKVGDGATVYYWTDSHACTIISRSQNKLTLQRDKAVLDPSFKPVFIPGGFAGTVINQDEQRYTYEPDPEGRIYKAYWSERNKCFRVEGCLRVGPGRHEFYDYNF